MKTYKYHLEKYHGAGSRHECPRCHDKSSFVYYVDENGEAVDESVGRCNHESRCGYHYTPSQYYQDNCIDESDRPRRSASAKEGGKKVPCQHLGLVPSFIDPSVLEQTLKMSSTLVDFLKGLLRDEEKVEELCLAYQIGGTYNREAVFWQIDYDFHIRAGKIMEYDMVTGKRNKANKYGVSWVHAKWKQKKGISKDFNLKQCLFGEHLLHLFPLSPVAVVESEKTAILGYSLFPQYVWLATGGKTNIDIMKMRVLRGRRVVLFPDVDGYVKWVEYAQTFNFCEVTVADTLERLASAEDREKQIDVGDIFIEYYRSLNA